MPIERQEQLTAINFSDYSGGMNVAQPPEQIAENEAELIVNYEYDYNRLRTRGGTSAPLVTLTDTATLESFFYDAATEAYILFGSGTEEEPGNVYITYLNDEPKLLGTLTGGERPVCCKFDNCIYIASGGKLQYFDYETLTTITSSQTMR